jgi:hypothetical protein
MLRFATSLAASNLIALITGLAIVLGAVYVAMSPSGILRKQT